MLLFSRLVVSDSLWPHGLQHSRPLCPSPSPAVCPCSCPLHQWCRPAISSSDTLILLLPSIFPSIRDFSNKSTVHIRWPNIGVSASTPVPPMSIQGLFPLGLTGLISLESKGLSGGFSSTSVWRHLFFGTQPSLRSSSHSCMWPLGTPWPWLCRPLLAE